MSEQQKMDQERAAWIDPVALGSCGPVYDAGWRDGCAEAKRLNQLASLPVGVPDGWALTLPDGRVTLEKDYPSWIHGDMGGEGYIAVPLYAAPAAQPATDQPAPGEVEEVEVVAHFQIPTGGSYAGERFSRLGPVPETQSENRTYEPLMTVAQHKRIVAQLAARDAGKMEDSVDFGFDDRSVRVSKEAYAIFLDRESGLRSAVQSLQEQLEELRVQRDEAQSLLAQECDDSDAGEVRVPVGLLEKTCDPKSCLNRREGRRQLRALLAQRERGE